MRFWRNLFLLGVVISGLSRGAEPADLSAYRLSIRDLVRVSVFGEPQMDVERRVDANGNISLPLIGSVGVRGLTRQQAEERVRDIYIEREIFIRPQISVAVAEYAPKEVSVIGQVREPGKIAFPIEAESLEIIEAISKAGGVTRIARSDSVRVTRKLDDGSEQTFNVDVERMFNGRGGANSQASFRVLPGDVIFIPERIL